MTPRGDGMLGIILIISFAMCALCSIRSTVQEQPGYAIAGALFGLVFLAGWFLVGLQSAARVAL